MALPSLDNTADDQTQIAIDVLGKAIMAKASVAIKGATKTIVPNIPQMVNNLTKDLEKGPIHNFTKVIRKLETLVGNLGLDLREYNQDLAKLLQQREEKAVKSEEKVQKLREQGVVARVNQTTKEVQILSKHEIKREEKAIKVREAKILKLETQIKRDAAKLQTRTFGKDENQAKTKKDLQKNSIELAKLKEIQEKKKGDLSTPESTTVDTGRKQLPMFVEMIKQSFLEPFQAMGEAFGQVKEQGKEGGKLINFLTGGIFLKAFKGLAKGIRAISGFFSLARLVLIAKFALVIGAIGFVATKIKAIGTFFKKLMDWFKYSWLGRKLGLVDEDSDEAKADELAKLKNKLADEKAKPPPGSGFWSDDQNPEKIAELTGKIADLEMDMMKKKTGYTSDGTEMPKIETEIAAGDKGLKERFNFENDNAAFNEAKIQNDALAEFNKAHNASKKGLEARGHVMNNINNVVQSSTSNNAATVGVINNDADDTITNTSTSRWD